MFKLLLTAFVAGAIGAFLIVIGLVLSGGDGDTLNGDTLSDNGDISSDGGNCVETSQTVFLYDLCKAKERCADRFGDGLLYTECYNQVAGEAAGKCNDQFGGIREGFPIGGGEAFEECFNQVAGDAIRECLERFDGEASDACLEQIVQSALR